MKVEIWKIMGLLFIAVFVLSTATLAHATSTLSATSTIPSIQGNLAYDSGKGEIFVQNGIDYGQIQVISDSTNQVVTTITTVQTNGYNNGIVYDSGKGEIFASSGSPNEAAPTITVVSDSTNTIVAYITTSPQGDFPGQPGQMAYDSGKGEIFVTDVHGYAEDVYVISDSNNAVSTSIQVGGGLGGLVYDSSRGEIFVAYSGVEGLPGGIAVISDSTNAHVANITVTATALAYDPNKGEVFAYDGRSTVSVISDSTNNVATTITGVTPGLTNMAYDPSKGEIFVGDQIISDTTNTVVAQLPAGIGGQVIYDSGKGETIGNTNVGLDLFSDSSSPSTSSTTTSSPSKTSTSATASSTPKVSEFSNVALVSVAVAVVTLCTIALTARTRKRLRE